MTIVGKPEILQYLPTCEAFVIYKELRKLEMSFSTYLPIHTLKW